MEKKDFDKWVKAVRQQWSHIPSLRGKQVKRNLVVLRSLMFRDLSTWDLAEKYIELTEPKWPGWSKIQRRGAQVSENASMYKRLKFLQEKNYVRKLGSIHKLTGKGFFLMFGLDPGVVRSMPWSRFNETITEIEFENKPGFLTERNLTQREIQVLKSSFSNQIRNDVLSYTISRISRMLLAHKTNMDEISETELLRLILSKLEKEFKKRQKKRVRH